MTPDQVPLFPSLEFEKHLWKNKIYRVAGIDEAGRGPWAGPVCAAAVILPADPSLTRRLSEVRDSKLMTARKREEWAPVIRERASSWGVAFSSAEEIDVLGIVPATKLAALRALASLDPEYLLTDYLVFPEITLPQTALVKGDRRSLSVAAASVLAKTSRDEWMRDLDGRFPGYGFARHKGYGTCAHRQAIRDLGFCHEHRKSFSISL